MIAVANFCVVWLLARGDSPVALFQAIWPVLLVSTTSIILVMSVLYHAIQDVLKEMERRERAALDLATRDPLTGIASRTVLNDRLSCAIQGRSRGQNFAVHMLDLDHFKKVNDVLGHHAGDLLLKEVAARLGGICRATDTVARLGGDEFVILQSQANSSRDVQLFCDRILSAMREPFMISDRQLNVGISVGSILGGQAIKPAEYLRKADIALYRAKAAGRDCFRLFSSKMDAEVHRRAHIESELRAALTGKGGLEVHYQPQIDAHGQTIGLEALLRWTHPSLGPLSPSEIVPIAEDVGLIDGLGEYVFKTACQAALAFPDLFIAVNLSPRQFARSDNLPESLKALAIESGVDCSQIELEITEHVFVEQGTKREEQIRRLRQKGFRVSLDDFGTGYSSLGYLRRFQVDKVKLDKSFVERERVSGGLALIRGVVGLAHSLGLEVVAEGIETAEQEQIALEAGCDGFQGYRYGHAMSLDELCERLPQLRCVA